MVESASGAIFTGPQGGPFTPPQVAFILAAAGLGFNWSIEGTLPPWLEATPIRGELRDNGSTAAVVKLRPAAQTLSPGTYDAELAFRKEAAAAPITQAVRLVIEGPGRLTVDPPVALVFIGPQGGPFMPLQIAFHLGAVGRGFKWKLEGTIPFWLEATPIQGELRDNGSAQAVIELRPAAQSLAPGTYDASLIFKKEASGDPITRSVRLIVEPQGALRVDPLAALVFTGSQGGPFTPPQIAINLAAEGRGFKWLLEGRIPFWLEVTPVRGELRDNGSATVVVQLEPTAQSLAPGTHDAQLTFNKEGPGDPITRTVRVVVKP